MARVGSSPGFPGTSARCSASDRSLRKEVFRVSVISYVYVVPSSVTYTGSPLPRSGSSRSTPPALSRCAVTR